MEGKTCCVTGHRDIPDDQVERVREGLRREVEQAIKDGYTHFISGFAKGTDLWFAEIVAEKRGENPALRLEAAIPYRNNLNRMLKDEYTRALLEACTEVGVISEEYMPSVYMKRNRFMVELSDRVIAVYDGREKGGTVSTMRFAHVMKKELREIPVGEIIIPGRA